MGSMFTGDSNLSTIYVGSGWSTAAINFSADMFLDCTNLVGGMGTTYDSSHVDAAYAHIDGGSSNPGYFTDKSGSQRGDADGDNIVNIGDVSALIDYLLGGNASNVNLTGADADQNHSVDIADVSTLIDFLLSGHW